MNSKEIAIHRADVLKSGITEYLEKREEIADGLKLSEVIAHRKAKILAYFQATEADWDQWQWQMTHRISDAETLSQLLELPPDRIQEISKISTYFRWAISPYYLSLIDPTDLDDPIYRMSIPQAAELDDLSGELDPMDEEFTNPAGSITRRYPDRVIINVTNQCAVYCRFCQRRRNIGQTDHHQSKAVLEESIRYIRENPEIRDVLITGGDPLSLSDSMLEWLLQEVRSIPHVEFIRLGTRMAITMPQRITPELCEILKKYHPIYINLHFNHPMEVTQEVKAATERLIMAGVPLGNQTVLLRGVNNNRNVMKRLNHLLLTIRVRPYYIFHPKQVRGTKHFLCSIDEGIDIMEHLRGFTSGMAIPTYVVNAPGGKGKIPILPQYILDRTDEFYILRTWEWEIVKYPNKK